MILKNFFRNNRGMNRCGMRWITGLFTLMLLVCFALSGAAEEAETNSSKTIRIEGGSYSNQTLIPDKEGRSVYLRTGSAGKDSLFNISLTDQDQTVWDLRILWNKAEIAFCYGSEENPSKLYRLALSQAEEQTEELTEGQEEEITEAESLEEEITEAESSEEEITEAESLEEEQTEAEFPAVETNAVRSEMQELLAPYGQMIAEHWQECTEVSENQSVILRTLDRTVSECTLYRYQPSAAQVEAFLNALADRLETDEVLKQLFAQSFVQNAIQEQDPNGFMDAGSMSPEELANQGQEMYESFPDQIRSQAKEIGSELEKAELTIEAALKDEMPVRVTLRIKQVNRLMNLFTMECYDQAENGLHIYGFYAELNVGYGNTVIPLFLGIVENDEKISGSLLTGTSSKKPAQLRGVMKYEKPGKEAGSAWPEGVLAFAAQEAGELFLKTEKNGEEGRGLILMDKKEAFDRIASNKDLLETPSDAEGAILFTVTDKNTALPPEGEPEELSISSLADIEAVSQELLQDLVDSLSEVESSLETSSVTETETESAIYSEDETETSEEIETKSGAKELFGEGSQKETGAESTESNKTAETVKPSLQEEIASEWRRLAGSGS